MKNTSKWSFQRFTKWFGDEQIEDPEFQKKLDIIYDLIVNQNVNSIPDIAKLSNCTELETVYKIMYLKNKRLLDEEYFVEHSANVVMKCSLEDKALLEKYNKFLYNKNYQVNEIALHMAGATYTKLDDVIERCWKDLMYLYNKGLLNGIILNDVDRTIRYYSVEKKDLSKYKETINCPNCGALVDVGYGSKERCSYCNTIVISTRKELY